MHTKTWYREPWPWLLMAGPAAVIVAGAFTSLLAFKGADGLVAADYYKQGLAINRVIARDAAAHAIGVHGTVTFGDGVVRADIAADRQLGDRIRLTLVHAARAGEDRIANLARDASGAYSAPFGPLPAGRWTILLETADWRLEAPADLRVATSVPFRARPN